MSIQVFVCEKQAAEAPVAICFRVLDSALLQHGDFQLDIAFDIAFDIKPINQKNVGELGIKAITGEALRCIATLQNMLRLPTGQIHDSKRNINSLLI